jgi:hypothetical protein
MKSMVLKCAMILFLLIIHVGCSGEAENDESLLSYTVQGRIMEVKGNEILVANVVPKDVALNYTTKEILGDNDIQPIYITVPDNIQNYKVGQLVKAWLKEGESVTYSFPAKANAVKVEILKK